MKDNNIININVCNVMIIMNENDNNINEIIIKW